MRTLPSSFKKLSDLNEIIFAHRNRSYGAYELRKHYNDRLLKAFLIAVSSLLLFMLVSFMIHCKPLQVNRNLSPSDPGTLKTFTFKEVKMQPPAFHQKPKRADHQPTLIVNDAASEQKEKPASVLVESCSNNSTINSASGLNDHNTGKPGIEFDTVSSGKNSGAPFMVCCEVMPSFPGGHKALSRYLRRHFDCSKENISREGKIILRFMVMKDGYVANVEVLRSDVGIDCVDKLTSLLLNSPRWSPGLQNNQPVNVMMVLPILIQKDSILANKGRSSEPPISNPLSDSAPDSLNRTQPLVYPNPFTESFTILYYENSPQQIDVELFDMSGRKIVSFHHEMQTGNNYLPIEFLQHTANGAYFARVRFDDHTDVLRVVKAQK